MLGFPLRSYSISFFFTLLGLFECLTELIGNTSDSMGNVITRRQPFGRCIFCAQERRNKPVQVSFLFELWPVWKDYFCLSAAAYLHIRFLHTRLMGNTLLLSMQCGIVTVRVQSWSGWYAYHIRPCLRHWSCVICCLSGRTSLSRTFREKTSAP
jgi:hypothetical protein